MGNTAMCKVCGSDKGLRTVGSLSNLDENAWPDYYCVDHFPVQPQLMLVRTYSVRYNPNSPILLLRCYIGGFEILDVYTQGDF